MAHFPKTRVSLILRLAQPQDVQAWQEFVELYGPALYRLALAKGLQAADAEDLTQDILFAVARAAERFQLDPERARFRTWLSRIARNLLADFYAGLARRPVAQALTDSWMHAIRQQPLTASVEPDAEFEVEYRRAVFQLAARRVRGRVAESSWQAFELTAIAHHQSETVAKQLDMSLGNLYVARCRVMHLLREEVLLLERQEEEGDG